MKSQIAIALLLSTGLAGCQSYQPLELNPEAHEREWAERTADDDRVRAYADQLATLNPDNDATFNPADGLTLREAELVALVYNPRLRAARLRAKVPLLGAKEAGRWEDPELDIDLLRIAESVSQPWILGTSLSFTIPISGRLEVEKDVAIAEADVELRRVLLSEWTLLSELRAAWVRWTTSTQRIALLEDYISQLDRVIDLARAQREAKRIGAPELRVLELEQVTRLGELDTLRIEVERRELAVKALLGLTPKAPVDLQAALPLHLAEVDDETRQSYLREHNLELTVARAEYEVADHAFRLEIRKQYPDLVLGPAYEREEGLDRIGIVLSIPIPILNQNRRGIAEARAARNAAKVSFESEYERLVADLSQAELGVRAAQTRSAYLEERVAPMVDQQMKDLQRLAELGDLDVLVILDAVTRTLDTKEQVLEARADEAIALNELRTLLRPLTTPTPQQIEDDKE